MSQLSPLRSYLISFHSFRRGLFLTQQTHFCHAFHVFTMKDGLKTKNLKFFTFAMNRLCNFCLINRLLQAIDSRLLISPAKI